MVALPSSTFRFLVSVLLAFGLSLAVSLFSRCCKVERGLLELRDLSLGVVSTLSNADYTALAHQYVPVPNFGTGPQNLSQTLSQLASSKPYGLRGLRCGLSLQTAIVDMNMANVRRQCLHSFHPVEMQLPAYISNGPACYSTVGALRGALFPQGRRFLLVNHSSESDETP